MTDEPVFPSGFPLQELPELTDEIFFAFHLTINKLLYINPAFERVWNMKREDVTVDLSLLFASVHPDDSGFVRDTFGNLKKDRQNKEIEFRILPGENEKWIKLNAYYSRKADNDIIYGTATDISAFKEYSNMLHKFSDKKNSILQILSHDLLGPLGNIQMSAAMMTNEYPEISGNESIMELITLINNNSRKSVNMIQDLVNSEFLQTSEVTLVKRRTDIVAKLRELTDQYKQTPVSIRQRFHLHASVDTLYINIDEAKFMQAVNNLISNALKFTPDDGDITITIEDKGKNVLISVKDTGIGIPEKLQPYLFEKFTRAGRTGIKGEPSTGLGMSIIKSIIGWHNGTITFESSEGKGSTFYIEVPKNG